MTQQSYQEISSPQVAARKRALNASYWILGSRLFGGVLPLARNLILTRLLFPEAFGLMALVGVVLQGLQMCSDVGIAPSIIKSERGDERLFLQTAWTLQIIRGFILWLACCIVAWPAALFYDEPMLVSLLPVAGLNILIMGFKSTAWATHDRLMKRGRMTIISYSTQILSLLIMLPVAWLMRSVWAIVIGTLCGSVISVILGHTFLPGVSHRLRWDREAVHEIVHFGKWVFFSTLLTFFAMQLDKLMLGKLIPISLLGVYSIALVLTSLPRDLCQQIASLILFPVLAEKVRESPIRLHERFTRARRVLLQVGLLLCLGVFAVAPAFFYYLYDPRYAAAGWIGQLLSLSAWVTILYSTTGSALLAFGDSKSLAIGNLANVIVTLGAAMAGFRLFGLPGFIVGYACGTLAGEGIQAMMIRRYGLGVLRQDTILTLTGLVVSGIMLSSSYAISANGLASELWLKSAVNLVIWLALSLCVLPGILDEVAPNLRKKWTGRLQRAIKLS